MNRFDRFPPDIRRSIPSTIEKGIYPRIHVAKDGSVSLIWWVRVWKDAKPISQSSESSRYSEAVDLKRKLIAEIETGRRATGIVDRIRLSQVLDDYVAECDVSDHVRHEYKLQADNRINPKLGSFRVSKLTSDRFKEYRRLRVEEIVRKKAKSPDQVTAVTRAANVTVNREGALIHAALVHGQRRTPRTVLTIPYFPKTSEADNARQGFLEADKYVELRDAFSDPAIRLLFIVAYNVGCRSGELRQFEWSMVDFQDGVIRLPGRITKNGKPRVVPIFAGDMMDTLQTEKKQRDELYPLGQWVFSRLGQPIKSFKAAWEESTAKAGLAGLLFHDLRRTAVRNMVRIHGLDRSVAQHISGHLTSSMFERYNIIDEADIKAAKRKVDAAASNGKPTVKLTDDLLATLAGVPEDKLKALVALLK